MLHGHQDMFTKPQFNIEDRGKDGKIDDVLRMELNNPQRLAIFGNWWRKQERCEHETN